MAVRMKGKQKSKFVITTKNSQISCAENLQCHIVQPYQTPHFFYLRLLIFLAIPIIVVILSFLRR